jgi:hypothetical protein
MYYLSRSSTLLQAKDISWSSANIFARSDRPISGGGADQARLRATSTALAASGA